MHAKTVKFTNCLYILFLCPTMVNGIALNKTKNERLRSLTLKLKKGWKLCVSSMSLYNDDVDCVSPRIFKFDPSTAVCSKQRKAGN